MLKGLLIKDFLLVKQSLSWIYLLPLAIIIVSGSARLEFLIIILMFVAPLYLVFFVYNTLYADENSHWARLEKGLPLDIRTVVLSKYLLGVVLLLVALVIDSMVGVFFWVFAQMDGAFVILCIGLGVSFGLLYLAILIPAVYRFGVAKGPIVFIGCVTFLAVIPIVFNNLGVPLSDVVFSALNPAFMAVLLVLVCAIALVVSFSASLKARK